MVVGRESRPTRPGMRIRRPDDTPARRESRILAGGTTVGVQPQPADPGLGEVEAERELNHRSIQLPGTYSPQRPRCRRVGGTQRADGLIDQEIRSPDPNPPLFNRTVMPMSATG